MEILVVCTVLLLVGVGGRTWQGGKPDVKVKQQVVEKKDDFQDLVKRVSSMVVVNEAEEPSIATVNNADGLRAENPAFYRDAENGDRLLIWSDRVVLYSESKQKIIAFHGFTLPKEPTPVVPDTRDVIAKAEEPVLEVRNGSGIAGKARTLSDLLAAEGLTILKPALASKVYPKTFIAVRSPEAFPQTIERLKFLVNAEVMSWPEEEDTKADIIVMVGSTETP